MLSWRHRYRYFDIFQPLLNAHPEKVGVDPYPFPLDHLFDPHPSPFDQIPARERSLMIYGLQKIDCNGGGFVSLLCPNHLAHRTVFC